MCDTIGIIKKDRALFGKNSDRSANEPQVIEFIEGHKTNKNKVKLTYIEIDEVEEVYSILISRPTWMWGAEMGVNEFGVCIGNEAIFTKKTNKKNSLIGMDLVRLGLERSKTAIEDEFYNNKETVTLKEMLEKENDLFNKLKIMKIKKQNVSIRYKNYWDNKNKRLKEVEEKNDN